MPAPPPPGASYFEVVTAAVGDMVEHGFDTPERLLYWQRRLREAAEASTASDETVLGWLRAGLGAVYRRYVDRGAISRFHFGLDRFTLERIKPHLRSELDRRILAAADLIRLNKAQRVEETLRRFSGWGTSLPRGGAEDTTKKRKQKAEITKPLRQLPYEHRRVLIDQGHKLVSSVNEVVATDGGAIAAEWHSNWREVGYDYRPDHKRRDGVVYLVRGSWAEKQGFVAKAGHLYTDEVTRPAEEPFCRCRYRYIYNLRHLPKECLTKKGAAALERAQAMVAAGQ